MLWCAAVIGYAGARTISPLRYRDDLPSLLAVLGEVALHTAAVVATGMWESPFVFSLITAICVAGFARGYGFAGRIAGATVLAVAIPDLVLTDQDYRLSAQWAAEFGLVAIVAGYARRISGEADQQQSLALDRLGRLADANALLYSLHRVAQTLPASLDLDEALDTTIGRMRDLFDFSAAAILLRDDTDETWVVARREGARLPSVLTGPELPPPVQRAMELRVLVNERDLAAAGGPGLAGAMGSGLYAVLLARGSVIGAVAIEHSEARHFSSRDQELLEGFAEPAALAIDNARWFARLRTVGAEEERTRIARDLHDRIGQSLAYLAFELDRLVKSENRGDDIGPALDQLRADVRAVTRDVRDTLYDLRTDVSEANGYVPVLESYLERVRARAGLHVTFRAVETARLPMIQERELFRVTQEAVANIEKHARATRVSISWDCDGHSATLEVGDDGDGFPVGQAGRYDSYGLTGMRERASSIGATLDVDSSPGKGTRVRCHLDAGGSRPAVVGLRRTPY
ncbi:MAG: GAF domain-containing protein [Acidimicrobiia bacterium]